MDCNHRIGRRNGAAAALAVVIAVGWLTSVASAQEDARITIELMVSQLSDQPGKIDPRASELVRKLQPRIRFESLRVLEIRAAPIPQRVGKPGVDSSRVVSGYAFAESSTGLGGRAAVPPISTLARGDQNLEACQPS